MERNLASQTAIGKSSDIQELLGMFYDQINSMEAHSDELQAICERVSTSSKMEACNDNKVMALHQGGHLGQLENYIASLAAINVVMASSVDRLNRYL